MSWRRKMEVAIEEWPLTQPFTISRGVDLKATVAVVRLFEDGASGWGESTPYARYGETPESVVADIEKHRAAIETEARFDVRALGLRGAAANALDCALVDLAAKRQKVPAWQMLGEAEPRALLTTMTVTLGTPEKMAADALKWPDFKLLKVKLGAPDGDVERIEAIRKARPDARLICDANEGWSVDQLENYAGALSRLGVEMIEQPCRADSDEDLRHVDIPIALCADESCHVASDVEALIGKYDLANIKLDKTGGITGALELAAAAKRHNMGIMVGCMLGTSLAMAPGVLAAQHATFVDLDGPLSLVRDRSHGLVFRDGMVHPATRALWG